MKKLIAALFLILPFSAHAVQTIATVNGIPVTDADVTARVKIMQLSGQNATNIRVKALANIIDDQIQTDYAAALRIAPADADIKKEISAIEKRMGQDAGFFNKNLDNATIAALVNVVRAEIAWQMVLARTIIPNITVTDEDVAAEKREMAVERGLPVDVTFVRLVGIPADVAKQLTKPKSCDAAEEMARALGGDPVKLTAAEYELTKDIRERLTGLPALSWSPLRDNSILLVCSRKNRADYKNIDGIMRQNAVYKQAMFQGAQIMKQQKRKTVIIINDSAYKPAV